MNINRKKLLSLIILSSIGRFAHAVYREDVAGAIIICNDDQNDYLYISAKKGDKVTERDFKLGPSGCFSLWKDKKGTDLWDRYNFYNADSIKFSYYSKRDKYGSLTKNTKTLNSFTENKNYTEYLKTMGGSKDTHNVCQTIGKETALNGKWAKVTDDKITKKISSTSQDSKNFKCRPSKSFNVYGNAK